jgi:enoyl-CoA hydratase
VDLNEKKQNAVAFERECKNLVIKLVRPERRNPLSIETLEILDDAVTQASSENQISKIIFTGAGDVFASGANLREIAKVTPETAREFALRGQSLMKKIADSPKLTIAAINGFCFGGALDLALSCRLRIASPNAVFCHPGANLGIITGWGGTQRLPRLVGEARALEMFLTAKQIGADEALKIGLVDLINQNPVQKSLEVDE